MENTINSNKIKIIFLGTPDYAGETLKLLLQDENVEVLFTITKEDKTQKRGMKVLEPEVKKISKDYGIACYQPKKIKEDKQLINLIKSVEPDFLIVVAYGQILSQELLDIPKKASINGHASLLPKYRGPSPIQFALLNGDNETGVTTMLMSLELDKGDILEQEKVVINNKETAYELYERLKYINANLVLHTIKNFDNIKPVKQNEDNATYSHIIKKEDGLIDVSNDDTKMIYNKVFAYNNWPTAYFNTERGIIKLFDVDYLDDDNIKEIDDNPNDKKYISKELFIYNKQLYLKTLTSYLKINVLQPESRNKMSFKDYINGIK